MKNGLETPIVLGIDPGSRRSGYAVLSCEEDRPKIEEVGVIELTTSLDLEDRLVELASEMSDIIKQHNPTIAALEGVFSHGKFPRSALILGHARGVCLLECRRLGMSISTIAPAEMKRVIAGSGRATKPQVQRAVAAWCGLKKPPEPNDAADALGMALFQLRKLTLIFGAHRKTQNNLRPWRWQEPLRWVEKSGERAQWMRFGILNIQSVRH